ncbi:MAG: hypothetical protein LBL21_03535 [Rickettsiales bacterium]|jgi:hypothetical protein|nr:hypothetical protein [Rickettsiales bacterium]
MRKSIGFFLAVLAAALPPSVLSADAAADKAKQAEYNKAYGDLRKDIREKFSKLEKAALNKSNGDVTARINGLQSGGDNLVAECNGKMKDLLDRYGGAANTWDDDKHKLCGNYNGMTDGVEKNISDAVERLKKEQGKAEKSVNSSADKVTGALDDATAAVNANSNTRLKSAASALRNSVADLKKTVSGKNNDTMFNELTRNGKLKDSASALIDALGKASSGNADLRDAASKLTSAMNDALNSTSVSGLGAALDAAAGALDEAAGFLDAAIKEEAEAEASFKSDFDKLTQAFRQVIEGLKK